MSDRERERGRERERERYSNATDEPFSLTTTLVTVYGMNA